MFTGLVQAVGVVREMVPSPVGIQLVVDPGGWGYRPSAGDSISVSGCCLTVTNVQSGPRGWAFDVVPETLRKTRLGTLAIGARVNLEHAVTPATLLGGHFVQGHVDGMGTVERVWTGERARIRVRVTPDLMTYLTPQGSIAVDGVSLTIAALGPPGEQAFFEVALIPTTLAQTTLGELREADPVNVETDMIAKTVVGWLERTQASSRAQSK